MNPSRELYACLLAKEFSAQAMIRLRPDLRKKAVVIVAGDPPLQTVCSFNAQAQRLGVTHAMTRVELDTFSSLTVLARSPTEEACTKAALLECAASFSPRLEDRSNRNSFLCVLDIAGTEKLLGTPEAIAEELLARVQALGISASIGISSNVDAAVCLVRGSSCRIAFAKSGDEARLLAPLPLTVLDLSREQSETFNAWGIRMLGSLAALPEADLIARMGQDGKRLRLQAMGKLPHLFIPIGETFRLEETLELDTPVEQLESLLFVFGMMLEQLILRASARVLALASVTIALSLEAATTYRRTISPALPTNERPLWIKLLHLDLDAHPPQAAVRGVTLTAQPGPTSRVQLGLFSPQLPETMRLDVTLARIRALVGEDCVGHPLLRDTHQQSSFRIQPFTVQHGTRPRFACGQAPAATRLLRPPEPVIVTRQGNRLISLHFHELEYVIEHLYGPWLTTGDWWSPDSWAHEQWDLLAQAKDGSILCCCLTRDPVEHAWQIVSLYD